MPFTTVGTEEAILKLLDISETIPDVIPTPTLLWHPFGVFLEEQEGGLSFYRLSWREKENPAGAFLADLGRLVDRGFVEPGINGSLQLTPAGKGFIANKTLPSIFLPLEESLREVAKV